MRVSLKKIAIDEKKKIRSKHIPREILKMIQYVESKTIIVYLCATIYPIVFIKICFIIEFFLTPTIYIRNNEIKRESDSNYCERNGANVEVDQGGRDTN